MIRKMLRADKYMQGVSVVGKATNRMNNTVEVKTDPTGTNDNATNGGMHPSSWLRMEGSRESVSSMCAPRVKRHHVSVRGEKR
jgi:hypothetical protein